MIPVEEAQARVLALAAVLPPERVALRQAAGRWLAEAAVARRDQPPFPASAMDGYAIAGEHAPGACFRVIGTAAAGHAFAGPVGPGQAVRIFTGAPVPEGTVRVVIQEDVTVADDMITLGTRPDAATHIRAQGQDFRTGDRLAPRRLRPADLALLAAMNLAEVSVTRCPQVALIATGDELVQPGEQPRDDQIVASNGLALAAMVEAAGGIARILPIARDTEASLAQAFALAAGADLIVTIGGASVGDHDLIAPVAARLGMEAAFHKVALRPGKPLLAGRLKGAALLGLPGNPVSAIVCGHLFMIPMIRAMQGDPDPLPAPQRARLAADVPATGPRTHYMRARLMPGPDLPAIAPAPRQDSALLSVLADAAGLLIRPLDDGPRAAGEVVPYLPI
jgi:molybdopterin molybdotransferase